MRTICAWPPRWSSHAPEARTQRGDGNGPPGILDYMYAWCNLGCLRTSVYPPEPSSLLRLSVRYLVYWRQHTTLHDIRKARTCFLEMGPAAMRSSREQESRGSGPCTDTVGRRTCYISIAGNRSGQASFELAPWIMILRPSRPSRRGCPAGTKPSPSAYLAVIPRLRG